MRPRVKILLGATLLALTSSADAARARGARCTVVSRGVEKRWAEGFARICDAAVDGYREVFGLEVPRRLVMTIRLTDSGNTEMSTDSKRLVNLDLGQVDGLLHEGPGNLIYGVGHEIGHVVLQQGWGATLPIDEPVHQGFAIYAGSVVVDHIWLTLGREAYPEPFDYSGTGISYLSSRCGAAGTPVGGKGVSGRTSCALLAVAEEVGHKAVGRAVQEAFTRADPDTTFWRELAAVLADQQGPDTAALVERASPKADLEWFTTLPLAAAPPPADFFTDLNTSSDGWTRWGGGGPWDVQAIRGSGHAALFRVPEGTAVVAVEVHAARYGPASTSAMFEMTLRSLGFQQGYRGRHSYEALGEPGEDPAWRALLPAGYAVRSPQQFFVVLDFDSREDEGVEVSYDPASIGHSFLALPNDHVRDFPSGDWMIRVRVDDESASAVPKLEHE